MTDGPNEDVKNRFASRFENEDENEERASQMEQKEGKARSSRNARKSQTVRNVKTEWNTSTFYLDNEHYLILQLAIENTGDNPADFVPGELQITANGTEAEWTVLVDGGRFNVTLDPAESVEDWVAFTIPTNSDEVVITADPVGDAYAAQFESDETLEVPFVPYE